MTVMSGEYGRSARQDLVNLTRDDKMRKIRLVYLGMLACFSMYASYSLADFNEDEEELARAYGDPLVSIATGRLQPITKAPAAATVITARDIQLSGARDLDQILESVPGLHVSVSSFAYTSIYSFRGISTKYNPQALLMINGIPATETYSGNRGNFWGGMPIEQIARVEIIRGSGSALYGADAFSGVINVITKSAKDIKGLSYGVRGGTFSTQNAWLQQGDKIGDVNTAFYIGIGQTNGSDGIIEKDAQSAIDGLFNTNASNAPGKTELFQQGIDLRGELSKDEWKLRSAYRKRKLGTGTGLAEALDSDSRVSEDRFSLDVSYDKEKILPNWDMLATFAYSDIKNKGESYAYKLLPENGFPMFPGTVLGNPTYAERHTGASVTTLYHGFKDHAVRMGVGHQINSFYRATEQKNFSLAPGPIFVPLPGGLTDVTGNPDLVYMLPHKRTLSYAFIQDEWMFVRDWTLNAGVRYDRYSDFGGTTNPRIALVWDAAQNIIVKAMHGRAFRAPSFVEQYAINNPVAQGNPNIKPERMAMSELGASWDSLNGVKLNLNLFYYKTNDMIRFVANADGSKTAQNSGQQKGKGFELEGHWEVNKTLDVMGHFSVQHTKDVQANQDAGLAPHRRLWLRADLKAAPQWNVQTVVNRVMDRKREPGDTRPDIPDYTTVDLTVRREKVLGAFDVKAGIGNIFNADAREPSFITNISPLISNLPNDLPLAGRSVYVQFERKL